MPERLRRPEAPCPTETSVFQTVCLDLLRDLLRGLRTNATIHKRNGTVFHKGLCILFRRVFQTTKVLRDNTC